ncbi:MAG: TusE/DsrC/DsvC family sulfur relay protein [Deltaproteobacteria bacterium]|nr:TusE/DsrC/DsvC family sulfur relay protein [Deltaproteobacteria bacterium]
MADLDFGGETYEIDEDGFLLGGIDAWNRNWMDYVKSTEGIEEITEEHWALVNVLQEYFKKNGIAPMVRILSKATGFPLKKVYELFPSGPGKGACKMAGLPKPTGCV